VLYYLRNLKGNKWLLTQIKNILEIFGLGLNTSFNEIPREAIDYIYYGCQKEFTADLKYAGISKKIKINFEGLIPYLSQIIDKENYDAVVLERQFTTEETCPECNGARLQKSSLAFKIDGKNIAEINALSLLDLKDWIKEIKEIFRKK
jgi:excinuclease ABC subunit A